MARARNRLQSRFRGALLGAAVADALGFPYQRHSRTYMASLAVEPVDEFKPHPEGFYPTGQFSDETQCLLAVAQSIAEAGRVCRATVASHLIPLWRDLIVVDPDPSLSAVLRRLVRGERSPDEAALDAGHAESGALAMAVPIGLWNVERPQNIPEDVEAAIGITHRDPRVLAAAAALAAAVAHNVRASDLILGEFLDHLAHAAGRFHGEFAAALDELPRLLCQSEKRALEMIESAVPDPRYPPDEDGMGSYVVSALLAALYSFLKSPDSYESVVGRCLRLGGNTCPTLAAAGAVSGSYLGVEGLPQSLVAQLLESAVIRRTADELYEALRKRGGAEGEAGTETAAEGGSGRPKSEV